MTRSTPADARLSLERIQEAARFLDRARRSYADALLDDGRPCRARECRASSWPTAGSTPRPSTSSGPARTRCAGRPSGSPVSRRRARGGRDRDLGREPRGGGRRGCGPAGCPRRRRHADDRRALQGRCLPRLRRRGDPGGRGHVRGLGGDGADPRRARADVRPPVRPPRHDHGPGNDRPRDRRGSPGGGRRRRRRRGRRHGLRRGGRGQGAASRRPRLRRRAARLQRPHAGPRRRRAGADPARSALPTASTPPSPATPRSPWGAACSTTSSCSTTSEILAGVRFAAERMKQVLEPAGAAALAAVLHGRVPIRDGERVCVVFSGGNVDVARLGELSLRHRGPSRWPRPDRAVVLSRPRAPRGGRRRCPGGGPARGSP